MFTVLKFDLKRSGNAQFHENVCKLFRQGWLIFMIAIKDLKALHLLITFSLILTGLNVLKVQNFMRILVYTSFSFFVISLPLFMTFFTSLCLFYISLSLFYTSLSLFVTFFTNLYLFTLVCDFLAFSFTSLCLFHTSFWLFYTSLWLFSLVYHFLLLFSLLARTKYLRKTLVFKWNSTLQGKFNFYFQGVFC